MPKELRQVSFRPIEVVDAINAYFRHRNKKLPPGAISKYVVNETPVTVTVTVSPTDGSDDREITIKTEELAAALILHCINNRIPLPAESEKSLRKVGEDGVSLFVVKESRR